LASLKLIAQPLEIEARTDVYKRHKRDRSDDRYSILDVEQQLGVASDERRERRKLIVDLVRKRKLVEHRLRHAVICCVVRISHLQNPAGQILCDYVASREGADNRRRRRDASHVEASDVLFASEKKPRKQRSPAHKRKRVCIKLPAKRRDVPEQKSEPERSRL